MKDFQDFYKRIDRDTLEKWDLEIRENLTLKLDSAYEDDPIAWNLAFNQSYSASVAMHLLEAYHAWLNE